MIANTKKVKIGKKDILCYDLTYGYLISITPDNPETKHGTIVNGTDLKEDEVMALRVSEVDVIYDAISRLTYPNLYNDDGTPKDMPEENDSKKKV